MRSSPRRTAFLVGLGVALWCAPGAWERSTENARTTADEPQYLMTALSIAEDRSLDVSDERAAGRYRAWHAAGLPLQEEVQADGSRVSPHDPLLPALLALPVATGGWLAAKLSLGVLAGALAAAMVWVSVERFDVPLRLAVPVVLAFSASAPLAVYATQVYPEIAAALAVTVAIGAIAGHPTPRSTAALGVAVVALPWLSVKYAPIAAALVALGLVQAWREGHRRDVVALGVALGAAAAIFLAAHLAWYGGFTPYAAGSHFASGELSVMGASPDYVGRSSRIVGLLADRSFGLAAWQPAYLLAVPALGALTRLRPRGWSALSLPLAVGLLDAVFVALTMHGWWFPGRQVVVVLPAAVIAVAWWAAQVRVAPWIVRAAAIGSAAVGASVFAWLVAQSLLGDLRLVTSFETLAHPLWRAWRVALPDYRSPSGSGRALHAAWIVLFALLVASGRHSVAAIPSRARVPSTA
ncbi:MAG: hypothetical protein M5T61_04855 [Acidimicrobiia bacterium]|nr:hypothetical protein [Acidimicrobiia bacterium]